MDAGQVIAWDERIGVSAADVATRQMTHRPHTTQGHRACLGLLALARKHSAPRLEAACTQAMAIRAPNLRSVTTTLQCGLDSQPDPQGNADNPVLAHENMRGPDHDH